MTFIAHSIALIIAALVIGWCAYVLWWWNFMRVIENEKAEEAYRAEEVSREGVVAA